MDICNFQIGQAVLSLFKKAKLTWTNNYIVNRIKDAVVTGVDDKLRGQVGACFYEIQDGKTVDPRALKKFLQKNLALYKVPREFHELKEIPRTSTGKIAKRKILEDYLAMKGL